MGLRWIDFGLGNQTGSFGIEDVAGSAYLRTERSPLNGRQKCVSKSFVLGVVVVKPLCCQRLSCKHVTGQYNLSLILSPEISEKPSTHNLIQN